MKQYSKNILFPYLPEGREILFTQENNLFYLEAMKERQKSTDAQFPTGAVAVKDEKIIALGHNRAGYRWKWLIKLHQKGFCIRRWFKAKTGTKYWMCPGCATNKNHSESRLVTNMEKEGRLADLNGSDVYLAGHWWCCKPCWDNMIRAGIKDVYVVEGAKEKFDTRK